MLALNPYIEPTSEAFRRLGEAHQHLVVLPAWQCDKQRTPGGAMGYATFGLVAARQHMTINSYYSGRYNMRAIEFHCRIVPAELVRRGPDANTAYVLDSTFLPWFEAQGRKTHECGVRDDFRLCVRRGTLH